MTKYIGLTKQNGQWKVARDTAGFPILEPDQAGAIVQARRNVTLPVTGNEEYKAIIIHGETLADFRAFADKLQGELNHKPKV